MLRRLVGLITRRVAQSQVRQAEDYLARLRGASLPDIAFALLVATETRHRLDLLFEVDLLDPHATVAAHPAIIFKLARIAIDLQKSGDLVGAGGVLPWLHTLRGVHYLQVAAVVRAIWGEMGKAAYLVPEVHARHIALGLFPACRLDGYDRFPTGFAPDRLS